MAMGSIQAIQDTCNVINISNLSKAINVIDNCEKNTFIWSRGGFINSCS